MNRRRFLELAAVTSPIIAGCSNQPADTQAETTNQTPSRTSSDSKDSAPPSDTIEQQSTQSPDRAKIHVSSISIFPSLIRQTQPFKIEIIFRNTGTKAGEKSYSLKIDDTTQEIITVDASPKQQVKRTVQSSILKVGTHSIRVGDISTTIGVERYPPEFVNRTGRHFTIGGEKLYFSGANCNYLNGQGPWSHADYDEVIEDAASLGLSVLRTFVLCNGNESEPCHQPRPNVFDERAFRRLDYVVAKAKMEDIRLIIPFINSYDEHGGMTQLVEWSDTATTHDDFYTDEEARRNYQRIVTELLNRENSFTGLKYKNDPTIMMWELTNELLMFEEPDNSLFEWIQDMAKFVKRTDSSHLLSTGSMGLGDYNDGPDEGTEFIRDHRIPEIDACSFHLYGPSEIFGAGSNCDPSDSRMDCVESIRQHVLDGHNILNKPVYLGEFGHPVDRSSDGADEQLKSRNEKLDRFYKALLESDADGGMFWQLHGSEEIPGALMAIWHPEDSETSEIIARYSEAINRKSVSISGPS